MGRIICFHGTSASAAKHIRKDGFRTHTWFADHLEDAAEFGGPVVFAVVFNEEAFKGNGSWQFWIEGPLSRDHIVGEYLVRQSRKRGWSAQTYPGKKHGKSLRNK